MIDKHIKFEELSDLIDNELTAEEREDCLAHVSQCNECKNEYESLLKTVSLASSLNKENLATPDFSQSTITIYKRREKNRLLFKVIPAIAASVIIVIGIGFARNESFNKAASHFALNSIGNGDTQKIIEHIGNFNVKVVKIDHSYIDTEFDKVVLDDFEKLLNKNNIKHSVIINSPVAINAFEKNTEAFVGTKKILTKNFNDPGKIQIRIFK
jgi:hypothetical protein